MTKETVRFPDGLVDRIRGAVEESDLFESRSEFHRVSSELLLDLLDPDHEPTNFSYRELRTEIEAELGVDLAGAPDVSESEGGGAFLAAYIDVRRRALGGDLEGAREAIDRRYDPTEPEALLLDEVLGNYREAGRVVGADEEPRTGEQKERRSEAGQAPEPEHGRERHEPMPRPERSTTTDGGTPEAGDREPGSDEPDLETEPSDE